MMKTDQTMNKSEPSFLIKVANARKIELSKWTKVLWPSGGQKTGQALMWVTHWLVYAVTRKVFDYELFDSYIFDGSMPPLNR